MLQNRAVVPGKDFRRREAGQMDHAPKAIASSDKMMPCGGCGQSRIDPAEDHSKALREDIRQRISHDPVFARHPQITLTALRASSFNSARGAPARARMAMVCIVAVASTASAAGSASS